MDQEIKPFDWQEVKQADRTMSVQLHLGSSRVSRGLVGTFASGTVVPLQERLEQLVEVRIDGRSIGFGRLITAGGKLAVQLVEVRSFKKLNAA